MHRFSDDDCIGGVTFEGDKWVNRLLRLSAFRFLLGIKRDSTKPRIWQLWKSSLTN